MSGTEPPRPPELPAHTHEPLSADLEDRLKELSALTGGLAHEIRNPLSTLRVNLQLLDEDWKQIEEPDRRRPPDTHDIARRSRRRIATLLRETVSLDRILTNFMQYVGHRELKKSVCDVAELIRDVADFYGPQAAAARVELRVQCGDASPQSDDASRPSGDASARADGASPPNDGASPQSDDAAPPSDGASSRRGGGALLCDMDRNLMKQAILNLLINAQQAMPDGGEIYLIAAAHGENELRIDVIDTGPGVPPDIANRIFTAYFSTKKGGTGLGLSMARRTVREHGGRIHLYSDPPNGSCFTIVLPREKSC